MMNDVDAAVAEFVREHPLEISQALRIREEACRRIRLLHHEDAARCAECGQAYPCNTLRALDSRR